MIDKPLSAVKDTNMVDIFKHIFTEADGRQKELIVETPTVKSVDERQIKLHHTGTELRIYTKHEGVLYYLPLTSA